MSDLMLIRTPTEDDGWTYFKDKGDDYAIIDGRVEVVARFDSDEPLYRRVKKFAPQMCGHRHDYVQVWPKEDS